MSVLDKQKKYSVEPDDDDEIYFKDIFEILNRYKHSIIIVTLIITLLAGFYTYFTTSVYQASMTLQIQSPPSKQSQRGQNDFIATALDSENGNIDDEISILKSYYISQKALKKFNIGTRYYTIRNFKTVELYGDVPFVIKPISMIAPLIGQKFKLYPIDKNHFKLTTVPSFGVIVVSSIRSFLGNVPRHEKPVYFSGTFAYGTLISNSLFRMSIDKVGDMSNKEYAFTITPNRYMFPLVQKSLSVSTESKQGSILQLTYEDNIPERAQKVLTAIANTYVEESVKAKKISAKKALAFIDKQLKGINKKLQHSASNLENFKSRNIVVNPKQEGIIAAQKLSNLKTQRNEIEIQESVLKNLLANIKKGSTGFDMGSMRVMSAPILSLVEKIQTAEDKRASFKIDYTDNYSLVIKINKQIAKLKNDLKKTVKNTIQSIQQRKKTLNKIITRQNAALESIPNKEMKLSRLSNSFSINQKIYEYLLKKRAETAIVESSTVSAVRVIDKALVGDKPVEPRRLLLVFLGLMLGLIIGVVQAFFRNSLANMIQTIGDLEKKTTLPLYSVLPLYGRRKSLYQDALRVFLTKLEFSPFKQKPKVITFTASVRGEGRTSTAVELANVMGKSGKKVIILDVDMRGSNLYKRLGIDNSTGMSTLLAGEDTPQDVIKQVSSNADVIISGPVPDNSYDLIMSHNFKILLKEMRSKYDYVIIISPPMGMVADALVLMQMSDLNLIVFKAGFSKKDFLENTNRFIEENQVKNVGMILNGLELKKIRPWFRK